MNESLAHSLPRAQRYLVGVAVEMRRKISGAKMRLSPPRSRACSPSPFCPWLPGSLVCWSYPFLVAAAVLLCGAIDPDWSVPLKFMSCPRTAVGIMIFPSVCHRGVAVGSKVNTDQSVLQIGGTHQ